MSADQKQRLSELREWLNLVVTLVVACGVGYLTLYVRNQRNEIRIESAGIYETISEHNADKIALQVVDGKLADSQTRLSEKHDALERLVQTTKSDTDLKIQHLTDVVNTRQDYAENKRKNNQPTQ